MIDVDAAVELVLQQSRPLDSVCVNVCDAVDLVLSAPVLSAVSRRVSLSLSHGIKARDGL